MMRRVLIILISILLISVVTFLSFAPSMDHKDGLVKIKSHYSVKETADRFVSIIGEKGINLFIRINHGENARKVEKELRDTELLIFGNPNIGTSLMQCGQSIGIDLPQKALIWEDEKGQVWIAYNDPGYLAERHNITGCDEVIKKLSNVLNDLTQKAASAEK